jgi:hypothetical protein
MKLISIAAAAALVAALGAGSAIAAETNPTAELGIDISAAGQTDASRMAFYNGLTNQQQTDLQLHCSQAATANPPLTAEAKAFCDAILKK